MARVAQAYTKLASQVTARARASKREAFKQRLEDSAGGQAAMFRLFRKQRSPPIAFVAGSAGVPVAQPCDIDRVMNQEWQPVFAGNGCPEEVAA
eukprot:6995529-Alexandrium_andersonii.AAC.1